VSGEDEQEQTKLTEKRFSVAEEVTSGARVSREET
jgi:hypothetical protein